MVSDLFDFSIYVDARIEDIEKWYVDRFLALRYDIVRRSRVALPPLLRAVRRARPPRGRRHLAIDQPAEPGREHPARATARDAGATQGRRPRDQPAAAAQAVARACFRGTGPQKRRTGLLPEPPVPRREIA